MKKFVSLILFVFLLYACNKQEVSTGKETKIVFDSFMLGTEEFDSENLSALRIFALDGSSTIVRSFSFTPEELFGNECALTLPIGSYRLLFIANADDDAEIAGNTGDPIDKITMKLVKEGDYYKEASDFLTAVRSIQLTKDQTPETVAVDLERRVGKVRILLTGLNPNIDSIKLELKQAPTTTTFEGKTSGNASILKRMVYTKGSGEAEGELLTFPVAEKKAEIGILYTIDQITYRGSMNLSPAIEANRIVDVTGSYVPSKEQAVTFSIQTWDGEIISGGEFFLSEGDPIVGDDRPISGVPTGDNLLPNGGFENWETDPVVPVNWLFDKAGTHMTVTRNTNPAYIREGSSSARMEQSTYFYQDIPVTEGQCYQICLRVNSNTTAFKWKVNCNWRKSTAVSSSGMLSTGFNDLIQTGQLGATDGWLEPFGENNIFRAPYGAKFLRIELRTYSIGDSTLEAGEGVYLDGFEVFKVE